MDKDSLSLYSHQLHKSHNAEDVIAALAVLGRMKREDYEPSIPDMGTLDALVDVEKTARLNRECGANDRKLLFLCCAECGARSSGFFLPHETATPCRGIPKRPHSNGEQCGGMLVVQK